MYLATVVNNLDAKGRVSVPADFRATATHELFHGIIVWPALNGGHYLEGAGYARMLRIQAALAKLPPYSEERQALQDGIFGESRKLSFDTNGRVTMPKDLLEVLQIEKEIAFVGVGSSFQIWNPQTRQSSVPDIQAKAMEHRHRLSADVSNALAGEGL